MSSANALLLIDLQANMFDPKNPVRSGDALLERVTGLLARARAAGTLVVFVRNCGGPGDPDVRGTSGWELQPRLRPARGELVLDKTTSDTFESTPLGDELTARGIKGVVIAGLQSEYCIRATTLGALSRNLEVTLVANGHSTFDGGGRTAPEISAAVNAELAGRARLANAEEVRFG